MTDPTPSGLALAIGVLRDAYPRQDFPDRSVALYASMLADLPSDELVEATKRIVRRSTFLPTIAELRREVAEAACALPSAEEAWQMVNDPETQNLLPLEVAAAMRDVGGRYAIRTSEQPTVIRSQFLKAYTNRREETVLAEMDAAIPRETGTNVVRLADAIERRDVITETSSMPPAPLVGRVWKRAEATSAAEVGRDIELPPATEEEKADAIRVLQLGEPAEGDHIGHLVWVEAHRIMDDETRRSTCGHDGWVAGCVHCETESAAANAWIERAEKS